MSPAAPYLSHLPSSRVSVLIVEDEHVSRKALATLLAASGYEVEAVSSAEEGLRVLRLGHIPQIALVDLDLPGMDGAEFIAKLRQHAPQAEPILLTAADRERVASRVSGKEDQPVVAVRHLHKPIDFKQLLRAMHDPTDEPDASLQ